MSSSFRVMSQSSDFKAPIAEHIWQSKYRFVPVTGDGEATDDAQGDRTLDDTFWRVARTAAAAEASGKGRRKWAKRFHAAMSDFGFLPAGRILAGAGTGRQVTLFNCFVMDTIGDSLGDIFDNVREAALTLQQGGGIGHDFSTLRPKGALVHSMGAAASGPVSFMDVWDSMCSTIMSAGTRRGAMMATLRCDHPDIDAFIDAKKDPQRLRNFNLSVLVTDAFMNAVKADADWPLTFGGKVYRTVKARALWQRLMQATYDYAEPGVIFIDRVNAENNLAYCETICATNPCGEQPLPPYGACLLGSINLTAFVREAFTDAATLDVDVMTQRVAAAVRLLDNMIDVSNYPLAAQKREAKAKRRIGLGITGLANALAMLGVRYGSDQAAQLAGQWMAAIQNAAYCASAKLAKKKGAFPLYDAHAILASPNLQALDPATRQAVQRHGLRNGCLTSIAPTGTISLLAGNVSSGIEPAFDYRYKRMVLNAAGERKEVIVEDYAATLFRDVRGEAEPLPAAFVTAGELTADEHLKMQAALQPHVDSSISKTINCPEELSFVAFQSVYERAYDLGLKGCTTYRPNEIRGAVLERLDTPGAGSANQPSPVPDPEATVAAEQEPGPSSFEATAPGDKAGAQASPTMRRETDGDGDVIYVSKPLDRSPVLTGATYKLKWPDSENAIYVTINDVEVGGRRRPFEIFINTRHLEHYAWTVALTRMISAVFRRGGDVSFVAEELKAIFDPQGGRWMNGHYVPSLLAAIGEIIEKHMVRIGFLTQTSSPSSKAPDSADVPPSQIVGDQPPGTAQRVAGANCPRCGARDYVRQESCWTCLRCGFSRCD
jgi:ribonucleoside-diphosphate reductase alpha chain